MSRNVGAQIDHDAVARRRQRRRRPQHFPDRAGLSLQRQRVADGQKRKLAVAYALGEPRHAGHPQNRKRKADGNRRPVEPPADQRQGAQHERERARENRQHCRRRVTGWKTRHPLQDIKAKQHGQHAARIGVEHAEQRPRGVGVPCVVKQRPHRRRHGSWQLHADAIEQREMRSGLDIAATLGKQRGQVLRNAAFGLDRETQRTPPPNKRPNDQSRRSESSTGSTYFKSKSTCGSRPYA